MPYAQPRQPAQALEHRSLESEGVSYVRQRFLVNLDETEVPYSTNKFLLTELVTNGGEIPVPFVDVVAFHAKGTVVTLTVVTSVIAIQSSPKQPGHYRTLVSCQPVPIIADVPVPEQHAEYVKDELDWVWACLYTNRSPHNSRGHIPQGGLMLDQAMAEEFWVDTAVDGICM